MALDWQRIELLLGQPNSGLGEEANSHSLPAIKLIQAENVEVNQLGRLDKRVGTYSEELSTRAGVGGKVYFKDTILNLSDSIVHVEDSFEDFAIKPGRTVGRLSRINIETSIVSKRQDLSVRSYDAVVFQNNEMSRLIYFYEAGGTIRKIEKDLITDKWLEFDRNVALIGTNVRAILTGDIICVFWVQNGTENLILTKHNPITGVTSSNIVISTYVHNGYYDVAAINDDEFCVAYATSSGAGFVEKRRVSDGSVISYRHFNDEKTRAVAVSKRNNYIAVSYYKGDIGNFDDYLIYTYLVKVDDWSQALPATLLETITNNTPTYFEQYGIEKITVAWIDDEKWLTVYVGNYVPPGLLDYSDRLVKTRMRSCTTTGTLSNIQVACHIVPVSKAWNQDDRIMILTSPVRSRHGFRKHRDYPSMHVLELRDDRLPRITSLFAIGTGTYYDPATEEALELNPNTNTMPHAAIYHNPKADYVEEAFVPYLARRLPYEYKGNKYFPVNVNWLESVKIFRSKRTNNKYEMAHKYEWTPQADSIGKTSYISGALPMVYDGVELVEQNFIMPPVLLPGEVWNLQYPSLSSGLQEGKYFYVAIYQYKNANGQIEYSQLSTPLEVDVPAPPSGKGAYVELYVRSLPLTHKDNVVISIYRTKANLPTAYYLVSNPVEFNPSTANRSIRNDVLGEYFHFRDELDDKYLDGNPMIYTTGNVLESDPTGPTKQVIQTKGRLWALDANGTNVFYSKPAESHEVVSFSNFQFINIQSDEPLTALGNLDDKVVVFSRKRCWMIYGDGPDKTGANGLFSEPQEITIQTGCIGPSAITNTKHGVVFIGQDGIYLMDRGGGIQDIGKDVRKTFRNHGPYWIVRHLPGKSQVRFFGSGDSPVLVWNYDYNQWTTFTYDNYEFALTSPIVLPPEPGDKPGSRMAYLEVIPGVSTKIVKDRNIGCKDDENYVKSIIETGHIQLSGIQGYQRVRNVSILLNNKYDDEKVDIHKLKISMAADDGDFYGTSNIIGSEITSELGAQARIGVGRQLCRAIRLKIEDEEDENIENDEYGYLGFINIAFNVGVIQGSTRLMTPAKSGANR